jgi:soluble lytic murein transglycosylase-like protein
MAACIQRRLARFGLFLIGLLWLGMALLATIASATEAIPHQANTLHHKLTQQAHLAWGLDAPVATFAAQIHTESGWQSAAHSPVGAHGIAQFMPATEAWINKAFPELASLGDASNPVWSMRALVTYDRYLWQRINALNACERMAMVLSSYNGGLGWLQRDRAKTPPSLQDRWFDGVEKTNAGRSRAAWSENRAYPRQILHQREALYVAAAWGPGVCDE